MAGFINTVIQLQTEFIDYKLLKKNYTMELVGWFLGIAVRVNSISVLRIRMRYSACDFMNETLSCNVFTLLKEYRHAWPLYGDNGDENNLIRPWGNI
jgi:hypothetical protein